MDFTQNTHNFYSNGFKVIDTGGGNTANDYYVYWAFAETPAFTSNNLRNSSILGINSSMALTKVTTSGLTDNSVTSAKIEDGTIVDGDDALVQI